MTRRREVQLSAPAVALVLLRTPPGLTGTPALAGAPARSSRRATLPLPSHAREISRHELPKPHAAPVAAAIPVDLRRVIGGA